MPDRPFRQPKYRHYKPKNLAVVRINGRDIYLGPYESAESWRKYGQVIAEWRATGRTTTMPLVALDKLLLKFDNLDFITIFNGFRHCIECLA